MTMTIAYAHEPDLSPEVFRDVLVASTLGARRPAAGRRPRPAGRHAAPCRPCRHRASRGAACRRGTVCHGFSYCCYLSDLAVDVSFQRQGIGRRLIAETHAEAGSGTTLILVAAPAAAGYYPAIGMVPLEE